MYALPLAAQTDTWGYQKRYCAFINPSHLINQFTLIKFTTLKTLRKSRVTGLRSSGQILQEKREQLESDRGVPLG